MTTVAEFSEKLDKKVVGNLEYKVVQTTRTFDNLASNIENKDIHWEDSSVPAFELEFGILITGGFVEKQLDDFAGKLSTKLSREVSVVDQVGGRADTPAYNTKVYIETRTDNPQLIVKFRYSNQ